jgi:hypothetical protein
LPGKSNSASLWQLNGAINNFRKTLFLDVRQSEEDRNGHQFHLEKRQSGINRVFFRVITCGANVSDTKASEPLHLQSKRRRRLQRYDEMMEGLAHFYQLGIVLERRTVSDLIIHVFAALICISFMSIFSVIQE